MTILSSTLARLDAEFPLPATKCWRCDDTGALQSASIVPRHHPCECEIAGSEIEGRDYHKRVQTGRTA